ncbi:MAG TPA: RNA methyltransferase, partial [Methylomirabilota bacterium]|nr:RNA methyltransferase [Methylomirabilota bacterium]
GFGMSPEMAERADIILAPVLGPSDYNHLSVRSAAGIILDRLRGQ